MSTTTGPAAAHRAAITDVGLPEWLTWTVKVPPRRRSVAATVEPGGAVVFTTPAPGDVADAVRRMRARLVPAAADKRDRGATPAAEPFRSGWAALAGGAR